MNHFRKRYALDLLLKKLKFSPVVLIQGPRQTGKSFLVKNLIPDGILKTYKTLDLASVKSFAQDNPDTFVRDVDTNHLLIIDEAQKVPALFDSIKAAVDDFRRPGQFILLGSTEFSKLTNIRESLTGRASRLRIFPFTLSETQHLPINTQEQLFHLKPRVSRNDLLRYLKNGGMPGLFGIKDEVEKNNALQDWIDLTAQRDSVNFKNVKIDPDSIMRILTAVATLPDTSAGSLAKHLRMDLRKVKTHLNVLLTLFVLNQVEPYQASTGKTQYYFCDVGFLNYFESTFHKKLQTWMVQEVLAQTTYLGEGKKKIYFYRSAKGQVIDLLVCKNDLVELCIKLFSEEKTRSRDYELLQAFYKKNKSHFAEKFKLIALTGTIEKFKDQNIQVVPWESIA